MQLSRRRLLLQHGLPRGSASTFSVGDIPSRQTTNPLSLSYRQKSCTSCHQGFNASVSDSCGSSLRSSMSRESSKYLLTPFYVFAVLQKQTLD
ncbi:hypothetical protein ElyMa_004661000 [Elysia marginata]|uniref:Cytochrome c domain-containing protein n=1 Tax=Elysia marginata TaxID=1093978 RepID=A0AAV4I657_9GAST|nr:hypothetical protein ElyMa_004661000 [Elysia marginata]